MMKKISLIALFLTLAFCTFTLAQYAEIATEEILSKEEPIFEKKAKDEIEISSFGEYSWVKQGSRKGNWNISINRIAYLVHNMPVAYADFTVRTRFLETDYNFDFGSYYKIEKGYVHGEVGFGADVDYTYRLKALAEIEYKLIGTLFVNVDGTFLNYETANVFVTSPGLVYYFGNHYIAADYGMSLSEGRDPAYFGMVRGHLGLNKYLGLWFSGAAGERLYDIFELNSSKQAGYILSSGIEVTVFEDIKLRVGLSYSKEKPAFIKRSINFKGSIKF
ncbi:MAG: YaiO family outer membrane beta-barrel protein [Candidatus Omnitrophica bacterium]|nr:YaiO family outer membrane beta-barrel protein [Candidatus Omnitrophota bacterium]